MTRPAPSLALVIPCYNEEAVLSALLSALRPLVEEMRTAGQIGAHARIYLVDDGSSDATWEMISAASRAGDIVGVKLSRNHGHQPALLAGLMTTDEDVVISLDADLQDDIGAIPKMLEEYAAGAEVVYGVRNRRDTDTAFKRITARTYYKFLTDLGVDIVADHADFRLMSRKAIDALSLFGETNLFLRGIVRQLGYPSAIVEYERKARVGGESKYPFGKMMALAVEGVTSFSTRPLRYVTWTGFLIAAFAFGFGIWAIGARLFGATVPGWASVVVPVYFLGGIQLIALGIIGEYIGRIYHETKRRPQFLIDKIVEGPREQSQNANS